MNICEGFGKLFHKILMIHLLELKNHKNNLNHFEIK